MGFLFPGRKQRKIAEEAGRQQLLQTNLAIAEITQRNAAFAQDQERMKAEAERLRLAASAKLGDDSGRSNLLRGLSTIATSPLGDTSEANIGRSRLLGN